MVLQFPAEIQKAFPETDVLWKGSYVALKPLCILFYKSFYEDFVYIQKKEHIADDSSSVTGDALHSRHPTSGSNANPNRRWSKTFQHSLFLPKHASCPYWMHLFQHISSKMLTFELKADNTLEWRYFCILL